MAKVLGVSRSRYYRWHSGAGENPKLVKLKENIERIFKKYKRVYGAPRITQVLKNEGHVNLCPFVPFGLEQVFIMAGFVFVSYGY